jgi:peptidoglycan hydrolase-like protein with peptidoglycan-binding domain
MDDEIAALQRALNKLTNAGLAVDGRFGPKTKAALIVFQTRNGLDADGRIGPVSWSAIDKALTSPTPSQGVLDWVRGLFK